MCAPFFRLDVDSATEPKQLIMWNKDRFVARTLMLKYQMNGSPALLQFATTEQLKVVLEALRCVP
jgi:hypothetical protein